MAGKNVDIVFEFMKSLPKNCLYSTNGIGIATVDDVSSWTGLTRSGTRRAIVELVKAGKIYKYCRLIGSKDVLVNAYRVKD